MKHQADVPMKTICDRVLQQDGAERVLLVMLPGATAVPEDFLRHGFVRELRQRQLPVDVILVDAHVGYYLERSIGARLANDIIIPARAGQYRSIWLLGISLGGMGALICARDHPVEIEGAILFSPFLGNRGRIAEILRSGGFNAWQPDENWPQDDEQTLLRWLQARQPGDPALPAIYLGYGTADRYSCASEMLAPRLPARCVAATPGGHDWETWTQLWKHFLDQGLFSDRAALDSRRARTAAI